MVFELLTKQDIRELLQQELPSILASFIPKQEEIPVTAEEICSYCRISYPTLQKYREQGKIPFIKLGKSYRYLKSDVKESLTRNNVI